MNLKFVLVSNNDLFKKEAQLRISRNHAESTFQIYGLSDLTANVIVNEPDFLLIDITEINSAHVPAILTLHSRFKNARLACAGNPPDAALVLTLVRAGIKDFLSFPFNDKELKEFFADNFKNTSNKKSVNGRIVTLYSPKGGTGVTLLTANLAISLANNSKLKVVVCDFSPQCGDISTYLSLTPQYTIRDIIDNHTILDESFLNGVLLDHPSGLKILAAPREDQEPPNSNHLNTIKSILSLLRSEFDVVLIDGGYLDRTLLQYIISESHLTFLVGNPDVVSLKGLVSFFFKLKTLNYDTEKIKVLVNRYNSKNQIDVREFEKTLKHPITATLPNNYMLCIEAVNSGQTMREINDKSDLVRKINELAEIIKKIDTSALSVNNLNF